MFPQFSIISSGLLALLALPSITSAAFSYNCKDIKILYDKRYQWELDANCNRDPTGHGSQWMRSTVRLDWVLGNNDGNLVKAKNGYFSDTCRETTSPSPRPNDKHYLWVSCRMADRVTYRDTGFNLDEVITVRPGGWLDPSWQQFPRPASMTTTSRPTPAP